jgi:hypothetical protein
MTRSTAARPHFLRAWLIWTAGFLAFPIAGFAATAAVGRVDDPVAAIRVDEQFTVFGAYGAVAFSALSGLLLYRLLPQKGNAAPDRASAPIPATR